MDYLSEKLLELIKNKRELTNKNAIKLSLNEIADIWNRNVIYRYTQPNQVLLSHTLETVEEINNTQFIEDINTALKKLANKKLIGEYMLLDESKIYKPSDYVCLAVLEGFHKYQEEKDKKLNKSKKEDYEKNRIFNLPTNAMWEDIEIKFKDRYNVEVYYKKKFLKKTDHKEMGFYRTKTKDENPDAQWQFLRTLSTFCAGKEEIKLTVEEIAYSLKIKKDNCMKIKEKLSKKLQENFGIYEDAFYNCKDKEGYKTRFKLKPESILRGSGEIHLKASGFNDNQEHKKPEKKEYIDF